MLLVLELVFSYYYYYHNVYIGGSKTTGHQPVEVMIVVATKTTISVSGLAHAAGVDIVAEGVMAEDIMIVVAT